MTPILARDPAVGQGQLCPVGACRSGRAGPARLAGTACVIGKRLHVRRRRSVGAGSAMAAEIATRRVRQAGLVAVMNQALDGAQMLPGASWSGWRVNGASVSRSAATTCGLSR